MKHLFKRIGCSALALSVVATVAGCSGNSSKLNEDGTQTHFSVFIKSSTEEPSDDNKIFAKIEEELGYTFEFDYLVGSEAEKTGVMIAGGDYPDLIECGDAKFIQAGALVPLDDYISEEKTPNIWEYIEPIRNKITYDDGHIYILPNYGRYYGEDNESIYQGPAFWIQKAVLEDAGYPEVTTLDEYFELIENYMEKYPTINGVSTIGYEILATTGYEWVMTTAPNYLAGNPNDGDVYVDKDTYEAEIYADSDYAKAYFKKLNEEYEKGVIDPECFTQSKDQYISKISSGRVLGMFDQHWVFSDAETSLGTQNMYERQYVPLPIVLEEGIEPWYRNAAIPNINQGYGISINCEDPESAVMMLETFLSEEWQKIFSWGIEGEDYLVDEDGRMYRTEEQREEQEDSTWSVKNKATAFYAGLPKIEGTYSDGNGTSTSQQIEEFEATLNDYDREFLANYNKPNWTSFMGKERENPVYFPAWDIDLIDGSAADYANQKLTDTSVKNLPKIIMAGESGFESAWSGYVSAIAELDIQSYEDRMNEVIKERVEKWSD